MLRLMLNTVAVMFVLAVVALGAQQVAPYDCVRIGHSNTPMAHYGFVICDVGATSPPEQSWLDEMYECMRELGVPHNPAELVNYRFLSADDIIMYPGNGIVLGLTNHDTGYIYIRRDLIPNIRKAVTLHEAMHAVRDTSGHDETFRSCAGI